MSENEFDIEILSSNELKYNEKRYTVRSVLYLIEIHHSSSKP